MTLSTGISRCAPIRFACAIYSKRIHTRLDDSSVNIAPYTLHTHTCIYAKQKPSNAIPTTTNMRLTFDSCVGFEPFFFYLLATSSSLFCFRNFNANEIQFFTSVLFNSMAMCEVSMGSPANVVHIIACE